MRQEGSDSVSWKRKRRQGEGPHIPASSSLFFSKADEVNSLEKMSFGHDGDDDQCDEDVGRMRIQRGRRSGGGGGGGGGGWGENAC